MGKSIFGLANKYAAESKQIDRHPGWFSALRIIVVLTSLLAVLLAESTAILVVALIVTIIFGFTSYGPLQQYSWRKTYLRKRSEINKAREANLGKLSASAKEITDKRGRSE